MAHRLGDYRGWWIEARCRCKTVQIPVRRILQDFRAETAAEDYARRLRCRHCLQPADCMLIDDIQSGAAGNPSQRQPTTIPLRPGPPR